MGLSSGPKVIRGGTAEKVNKDTSPQYMEQNPTRKLINSQKGIGVNALVMCSGFPYNHSCDNLAFDIGACSISLR